MTKREFYQIKSMRHLSAETISSNIVQYNFCQILFCHKKHLGFIIQMET